MPLALSPLLNVYTPIVDHKIVDQKIADQKIADQKIADQKIVNHDHTDPLIARASRMNCAWAMPDSE
jgi:hypothetical protein